MSKTSNRDRDEAVAWLRAELAPGDTLYTVVRHVARSGMSRSISVVRPVLAHDASSCVEFMRRGSELLELEVLDYWISRGIGHRISRQHGGIVMGGAGMDMGFSLIYRVGQALWPNGTVRPHSQRNGQPDTDGGYALKHRWLC